MINLKVKGIHVDIIFLIYIKGERARWLDNSKLTSQWTTYIC